MRKRYYAKSISMNRCLVLMQHTTEVAVRIVSSEKMFLKISQYLQEKPCVEVPF